MTSNLKDIYNISNNQCEDLDNNQLVFIENEVPQEGFICLDMTSDVLEMNEVQQLLYEWDLYYLREKFEEAGYDQLSDLEAMSELELEKIFPLQGDQCHKIRLRRKIVDWRKRNGLNIEVELLSGSTKSLTSSVNNWLGSIRCDRATPTTSRDSVTPTENETTRFDLKKFLETDKGKKIWKCYVSSNPPKLGGVERKLLIEQILEFHYTQNLTMNYEDFDRIAGDIANTFCGEKKDWYFHHVQKNRPTGKLYNKYRNESPKLNKIGYYGEPKRNKIGPSKSTEEDNKQRPIDSTIVDYVKNEEFEQDKECLQCINVPWSTVEIKFQNTFKGRQQELFEPQFNAQTFYKNWIIYRNPDAFRLIDLEFKMLYPGKEFCISKKWNSFLEKIIPIMTNRIKDKALLEKLTSEHKNDGKSILNF